MDSPASKHTLCIRISMIFKMFCFCLKRKKWNGKERKGVIQRDLANKH